MKTLLLLTLILFFTGAGIVDAQTSDKKWGIAAGAGVYGVFEKDAVGFVPELILNRYLSHRFDLAMKWDMGLWRSDLISKLDLVMGSVNLRFKLTDGTRNFRPYLYAGPGFLWDNLQTGLNFNVGLGSKIYFSPSAAFYFQAGYVNGIDIIRDNIPVYDKFWKVTAGIAFDFGKKKEAEAVVVPDKINAISITPDVRFSVNSPKNIPAERRIRETFPLRNYVFFDLGSTEIPDRYVLLSKNQVQGFSEDQLDKFTPKRLPGRSNRQMIVYYNVLNILGDRMVKNPSAVVRLSGASMEGNEDGKLMAESVKRYLVDVFGISPSRINTEGRVKPRIPSEQPGGKLELDLLREGDRRVSIWSESPGLLMEFQSGPDAPLRPVEIFGVQQAPLDSYVSFRAEGADKAFTSWSLEITDENGRLQNFGPYTHEWVSIPGKSILGTRPEGNFKVVMVGQTKNGNIQKKEASMHMALWTPPKDEEVMRFSVIYEFNDSKAIAIYEKYLTDIVTPKIPRNGKVIIHGYTDIIGEEAHNLELSLARANDVRGIMEKSLQKAGRSDVTFEVYGFGEDPSLSPFENKFPEERFYNRTVMIDILPNK